MKNRESARGVPYLDFYEQLDRLPFAQDIGDVTRHFSRRDALYRLLGIPPRALHGASIIEFGPGAGENALYTASLEPRRYVLVEANPLALRSTAERLSTVAKVDFAFHEALAETFESSERFDFVFAENMIPGQYEPEIFLRRLARFTAPGGILVVTCHDAASILAEIGLRVLARRLVARDLPLAERVARLEPYIAPHLAALPAMTRPVGDWILDNIEHPREGRTLSIRAAIETVAHDFEIYGSSPHFMTDWRWYKDIFGDARRFNERAIDAYESNVLNFLDGRETFAPHDREFGRTLLDRCESFYAAMQQLETSGSAPDTTHSAALAAIVDLVAPAAPRTAAAIDELAAQILGNTHGAAAAANLAAWWGRGTQYLSFIRR